LRASYAVDSDFVGNIKEVLGTLLVKRLVAHDGGLKRKISTFCFEAS
jgi:hypothetical protein